MFFKIGPPAKASGTFWDETGKSEIVQIYIGRYENRFKFIQFLYIENQNTLVPSKILGLLCEGGCTFFDTITLDYPSEFINGISGVYEDYCGSKYLRSISFHTNKAKYGPFIASPANKGLEQIEFSYQIGCKLYGFLALSSNMALKALGFIARVWRSKRICQKEYLKLSLRL